MDETVEKKVAAVQAAICEKSARWNAGSSPIAALSNEQKKDLLGLVRSPRTIERLERLRGFKAARGLDNAAAESNISGALGAPASWDWRNATGGYDWTTPPKDQGSCGSCVSFGALGALECLYKILKGDHTLNPDYSEAHLFFCNNRHCKQKLPDGTDDPLFGWDVPEALDYLRDYGVPDDACFAYTDHDQECNTCSDWKNKATHITGWKTITSRDEMKKWISTKGPLVADYIVYDDFFSYVSGIYTHVSGPFRGGHCVLVIGYNDAEKCWICKNSWRGTGWGENGYFRIEYGQCEIDDEMYAIEGIQNVEQPPAKCPVAPTQVICTSAPIYVHCPAPFHINCPAPFYITCPTPFHITCPAPFYLACPSPFYIYRPYPIYSQDQTFYQEAATQEPLVPITIYVPSKAVEALLAYAEQKEQFQPQVSGQYAEPSPCPPAPYYCSVAPICSAAPFHCLPSPICPAAPKHCTVAPVCPVAPFHCLPSPICPAAPRHCTVAPICPVAPFHCQPAPICSAAPTNCPPAPLISGTNAAQEESLVPVTIYVPPQTAEAWMTPEQKAQASQQAAYYGYPSYPPHPCYAAPRMCPAPTIIQKQYGATAQEESLVPVTIYVPRQTAEALTTPGQMAQASQQAAYYWCPPAPYHICYAGPICYTAPNMACPPAPYHICYGAPRMCPAPTILQDRYGAAAQEESLVPVTIYVPRQTAEAWMTLQQNTQAAYGYAEQPPKIKICTSAPTVYRCPPGPAPLQTCPNPYKVECSSGPFNYGCNIAPTCPLVPTNYGAATYGTAAQGENLVPVTIYVPSQTAEAWASYGGQREQISPQSAHQYAMNAAEHAYCTALEEMGMSGEYAAFPGVKGCRRGPFRPQANE